jgi:hypothetical protein
MNVRNVVLSKSGDKRIRATDERAKFVRRITGGNKAHQVGARITANATFLVSIHWA